MSTNASATVSSHSWRDEARDLARGLGGAAIIGIPLVYTMEMWQVAVSMSPGGVLLLLAIGFAANVGYNVVSGFRPDSGLKSALADSLEALAIGVVLAGVLLTILGVVQFGQTSLADAVNKIALEALPLSLGVSVANTQFSGGGGESGDDAHDAGPKGGGEAQAPKVWREAISALAGSLVFAFNVAMTEEIVLIAERATWAHLLGLVVFSLLLSYSMIFVAGFDGLDARKSAKGLLQTPWGETLLAYTIALVVALGLSVVFHGVSPTQSPQTALAVVLVLGLPATVGGAAGRLIA